MLLAIAKAVHLLSITVWVGGMFFAYMALRPALGIVEPPIRLTIWSGTLRRFFIWVWYAVPLVLLSGFYIISQIGGFADLANYIHAMMLIGLVMALIYVYVFFVPYRRLTDCVKAEDWPAAGAALVSIRKLVAANLSLGLVTIIIACVLKSW